MEVSALNYLNNLEKHLNTICNECGDNGTEKCNVKQCNIAFTKYIIKYTKENSQPILKDGEILIPKDDIRFYDEDSIAYGIANICKLCKECDQDHNEQCVISLMRQSLEITQVKDQISYPGNILGYLMNVSKQNTYFAELIKDEYMKLAI